jgi:hypothetical protein
VAAILPATIVEVGPSPEGADVEITSNAEHGRLLGSTLFHPPKA